MTIEYTEVYEGYTIEITRDEDRYDNSRSWDNLGTMACVHRRYSLGDVQPNTGQDFLEELSGLSDEQIEKLYNKVYDADRRDNDRRYIEALVERCERDYIMLPLYLYDHSALAMNTTGFSCRWDSGQIGYIYVSKDKVRKEYKVSRISKKLHKAVQDILDNEVKVYNAELQDDVYTYSIIDKDGDYIEACGGYIDIEGDGSYGGALKDARDSVIQVCRV